MKVVADLIRTTPVVVAIAVGVVAIFYLANDRGITSDGPIVTDIERK